MKQIIKRSYAIMNDLPRYYTGKACGRGHLSERRTSNGVCIECQDEDNAQRGTGEAARRRVEQKELLEHGGPMSAEEATAVGLKWFNAPTSCGHDVVDVGRPERCYLCGAGSKQVLDLLS